jgi:putative ABC transport system ATP-binding protein
VARRPLTGASDEALTTYCREHVGFGLQFYNLIPSLTVSENVALVTDIARDPMPIDEAVGLGPSRHQFPSQLSGAEQQRVAIARATAKRLNCCCATSPPVRWTTRRAIRCWR